MFEGQSLSYFVVFRQRVVWIVVRCVVGILFPHLLLSYWSCLWYTMTTPWWFCVCVFNVVSCMMKYIYICKCKCKCICIHIILQFISIITLLEVGVMIDWKWWLEVMMSIDGYLNNIVVLVVLFKKMKWEDTTTSRHRATSIVVTRTYYDTDS